MHNGNTTYSIKRETRILDKAGNKRLSIDTNGIDTSNTLDGGPLDAGTPPENADIKGVPASREMREQIRRRAIELTATLDKSQPLDRYAIETHSRLILEELGIEEAYLGWTMVAVGTAFWRDQVAATPYHRRLLLLPHCLRDAERCPARFNELGLLCRDCGACRLMDLRSRAERLGYNVLIAEGSPVVMQIIIGGHADALVGVSCLNVLERSLEKILLAGIPCMAVPLLAGTCHNTTTDEDWVREMIDTPYRPASVQTRTYVHLLRCAKNMFEPKEFDWLVPRARGSSGPLVEEGNLPKKAGETLADLDPLGCTEALAYDFLLAGGKRARPFVTLAVYDAMTGGRARDADGAEQLLHIPEYVKRVAAAIEIFHKASLVHDDIEDNDRFRYGNPTLHDRYGTATAINVGDYLIGLGYRLVSEQRSRLPSDAVADILAQLADAHTRLSEGQGAELAWRDAQNKHLEPLDAIKIYALKTAPAFEAALYAGIRLAGPAESYRQSIGRYARHLGVAFQILNDLEDWRIDRSNKRGIGGDVLGGRPTVLWALALQESEKTIREELESLLRHRFGTDMPAKINMAKTQNNGNDSSRHRATVRRVGQIYDETGVFETARALIEKHHQRAREVADEIQPEALRYLLHYLADSILVRNES
ncbi:MAG: polyprenyl synthetase family protein [Pirellulales bacterium]|nr:polyprenyl synthetase family protein [Pirellulales bacterium]